MIEVKATFGLHAKGVKPKTASNPNSAAASASGRQAASATTAPKATPRAASGIPLGHESSASATTSIDQWVLFTHSVHNAASVAAMQGRAVAAAASVRSVHTSAPSTVPAANGQ